MGNNKPDMNIFTYGLFKNSITGFFHNIKQSIRNFNSAIQRIKWGFSAQDTWNFDYYICGVIAGGLEWLAANSHSYPGTTEFPTYDSWSTALIEKSQKIYNYMNVDEYKMTIEQQKKIRNEMKEALHWVVDHIYDLWD